MKLYIKIVSIILSSLMLFSCNASDNNIEQDSIYQQYGSPFQNAPSREDAIIYQVNIRAFSNAGNLNGVTEKLSYIQELGANVVYLMPIYPVGVKNSVGELGSPYSVRDYKAVNPEFGNLEDLRTLVNKAHELNMSVILDWVPNHTSWDNAWITDHPDWYAQDENGKIIPPPGTNWNDVAQLNFDNNDMRLAMIDAMSYWVYNANIDGFRCDYADGVQQSFWGQAIPQIRKIKNQNFLMLAEGSRVNHFQNGFDYTFGFNFFSTLEKKFKEGKPATIIQDSNAKEYENNYNNDNRIVRYTTNHDVNITEGTPLDLFGGKKGSIATFVVAAYMKSVPMIYNAQEVGYAKRIPFFNHTPIDWSTGDQNMLAEYKKIIAFRKSSKAIKTGTYTGYSSTAISAFTMETSDEKVFVLSNLTNATTNYILPDALSKMIWKDGFTDEVLQAKTEIILAPYQYMILKN